MDFFQEFYGLLSCRSDRLIFVSSASVQYLQDFTPVLLDLLLTMYSNRINCIDCHSLGVDRLGIIVALDLVDEQLNELGVVGLEFTLDVEYN